MKTLFKEDFHDNVTTAYLLFRKSINFFFFQQVNQNDFEEKKNVSYSTKNIYFQTVLFVQSHNFLAV